MWSKLKCKLRKISARTPKDFKKAIEEESYEKTPLMQIIDDSVNCHNKKEKMVPGTRIELVQPLRTEGF